MKTIIWEVYMDIKNIVILKDLPSNIVDEAIVVLKNNEIIKDRQFIEKKDSKKVKNKNDYIVKEAENVIVNFISNIEKQKNTKDLKELEVKYKQLKLISLLLSGIIVLSGILKII